MNATDAKVEGILRGEPGALKVGMPPVRVEGAKDAGPALRLRDNALDGFRFGALLDWRVRLAAELLMHSPSLAHALEVAAIGVVTSPSRVAEELARLALDTASALVDEAERRGLIEEFSKDEAQADLRDHVKRQARYQVAFQIEQQREVANAQGQVQTLAPGGQRFPGN